MQGLYQQWGFRSSPFETRPLPPSEEGKGLLVGREREVQLILRRILDKNKIVTVEGDNGIGKTSINNVAAYTAYKNFIDGKSDALFIPCNRTFQLHHESKTDDFIKDVFLHIALTLLERKAELAASGRPLPQLNKLNDWLSTPAFNSISLNMNVFGYGGGGGGYGQSLNTTTAFANAGLPDLLRKALSDAFPSGEGGGVICTIDNLELLRESAKARSFVEILRDELLTIPGLRWILCGSTGIVRSLASTPRLDGYLHSPVDVAEVDPTLSTAILTSRVEAYKASNDVYLPLLAEHFKTLFGILNSNIRDALSAADNFCNWVCDSGILFQIEDEKDLQFQEWLKHECNQRLESTLPILSPRPLQLFDDIISRGGQCAPGDHTAFKFNSASAMRTQILRLEAANLVRSARDEDDKRRKSIVVTSNGWFVNYARKVLPSPLFASLLGHDNPNDSE